MGHFEHVPLSDTTVFTPVCMYNIYTYTQQSLETRKLFKGKHGLVWRGVGRVLGGIFAPLQRIVMNAVGRGKVIWIIIMKIV